VGPPSGNGSPPSGLTGAVDSTGEEIEGSWSPTGNGGWVAFSAPSDEETGRDGARRWWLRPMCLGLLPGLVACAAGVGLWSVAWFGERAAVATAEALPGLLLAIGVASGGRLEGDFVNASTSGFGGLAFALPLLSGLLIARWLHRTSPHTYLVGILTTIATHAASATALGAIRIYDPTSFSTAQVSWLPVSSVLLTVLTWGTAWLATRRTLARTLWIGLGTTMTLGAGTAIVLAIREGLRPELLPTAAVAGSGYGPNLVAFSLVWAPGVEAGVIGERRPDVESLVSFAGGYGWWLLLIPTVAFGLLCVASSHAQRLTTAGELWSRLREVLPLVLVAVPLTAATASPRYWTTDDRALWVGVPDAPASLFVPSLILLALITIPQVAVAIRAGESWPRDLVRSAADQARRLPRPSRPTPNTSWHPPAAQHPWPSPPQSPTGAQPAGLSWSPPPFDGGPTMAAAPAHNPFGDAPAPPVSAAWSQVAPALTDPGAHRTTTSSPPPVTAVPSSHADPAASADAWRHAPPPTDPAAAADAWRHAAPPSPGPRDRLDQSQEQELT
jgi:hypothetical protein